MAIREPDPPTPSGIVLAIDPGTVKCGMALVSRSPVAVLDRRIVAKDELVEAARRLLSDQPAEIVIGAGTSSEGLARELRLAFPDLPIHIVDERDTSRLARERYCREVPAHGWRRLLPAGLRFPEEPYDDFVAVILAEEFLRARP